MDTSGKWRGRREKEERSIRGEQARQRNALRGRPWADRPPPKPDWKGAVKRLTGRKAKSHLRGFNPSDHSFPKGGDVVGRYSTGPLQIRHHRRGAK